MIITTKTVDAAVERAKAAERDVWVTEDTEDWERGDGSFRLRAFANGKHAFYFRYSLNGVQKHVSIDGKKFDSLKLARAEARRLSDLYKNGHRDLHRHLAGVALVEDLKTEAEAARLQAEKTERELAELERTRQGTLAQLLDAYVADLERRGKASARDARNAFRLDVVAPFPELAARPAKEIVTPDITAILRHCLTRPVARKGHGHKTVGAASNNKLRQCAKLRSYLQAAFSFGLVADNDALQPAGALMFGLTTNPARDSKPIEGANRANTWALTKDELRAVLLAIEALPERRRAIAKTMLYLAGQRVEMLCRVAWGDLYDDGEHGAVMQMLDLKGGHGTPARAHLIPITERLGAIMAPLLALKGTGAPGPFTLRGSVPASSGSLQRIFSELGDKLAAEGKTRPFTWRNMRCTTETHLASLGVTEERRAWLLSHGRSGIQAKAYDRYNYLMEKHHDLDKWARYLDALVSGTEAKVIQLHA